MSMPSKMIFLATTGACLLAAASVIAEAATEAEQSAKITALSAQLATLQELEANNTIAWLAKVEETKTSVDSFWTLIAAFLVFFMQAGFGMLEVGTVRKKNMQNILIKNMVDAAVGGITFWAIGYGFAFGTDAYDTYTYTGQNGTFIGGSDFFLMNEKTPWTSQVRCVREVARVVQGVETGKLISGRE